MPRHPRLFIPEATYHVYCRVTRGEFVFDDPFEAAEFVSAVREVRDLHGWRIFAWTLMANHYHLVIKTGAIPLWRSMLRLQSEVARAFNKRHRYLGRLFEHHSGYTIEDIRSSLRRRMHLQARIEFATLGVSRYGIRSTEVARFIQKHPTSVARWISFGLRKQLEDRSFRERIDDIDRRISWSARNNPRML